MVWMLKYFLILLVFAAGPFQAELWASCSTLIKGDIAFDVNQCGRINPEKTFLVPGEQFAFIRDLAPNDRKSFLDNYRGLILRGKVVRSLAIRSGLSPEKGALNGEDISVYLRPSTMTCGSIMGKRIKAYLDEACCAGSADAPCLLNSTYVLKNIKIIGQKASIAGNKKQMELNKNPVFRNANNAFTKGDYATAVKLYESLRAQNKLDLRGHYYLGFSYRMLDDCQAAAPILETVQKRFADGKYWSQDELHVRRGTMLYARCLSKLKKEGQATLILQGFLLNPVKYKSEIRQSMSHADFGWIQTTKDYQKYLESATKALQSNP